MRVPHARSPGDLMLIAVFIAILLAPALLAVTGHAGPDTAFIVAHEQRIPFKAPRASSGALATAGWERDVERDVADRFPLRTGLIESYSYAKFAWLGGSPNPFVVRGPNGWLFWTREERQYVSGSWTPDDADLARVARLYEDRARWCARHGMRYVLLFAPNKSSIYAAEAPPWYRATAPTPLDRLLPMLRARGVGTIDVRAALVRAARNGDVYMRGDTHWNDAGALIAYRATVGALHDAGVRDAVAPTGTRVTTEPGDLLNISGVGARIPDHGLRLDYRHREHAGSASPALERAAAADFDVDVSEVDDPSLPTAVLIGDSFSIALVPLFAQDFRRTVHLRDRNFFANELGRPALLTEKPAVVIQELLERRLVFSSRFRP